MPAPPVGLDGRDRTQALIRAGASLDAVDYPTGNMRVDEVL
jgi:hypothetical protein